MHFYLPDVGFKKKENNRNSGNVTTTLKGNQQKVRTGMAIYGITWSLISNASFYIKKAGSPSWSGQTWPYTLHDTPASALETSGLQMCVPIPNLNFLKAHRSIQNISKVSQDTKQKQCISRLKHSQSWQIMSVTIVLSILRKEDQLEDSPALQRVHASLRHTKDLYPQKHRDRLHFQNQCLKDPSGVSPRAQGLKMCAGDIALERWMSILATQQVQNYLGLRESMFQKQTKSIDI